MNLNDFIKKYNGKIKGYPDDNKYRGECLSIVKIYIKECFGINPPPSGTNSAYGYWSRFPSPLGSVFEKVSNTPSGIPQKGDIIIWKPTKSNKYGHIAIFISGSVNSFKSFDQNYRGKQAHIQGHYYTNVVGWLHPKGGNMGKVVWDNVEVIFTDGQVREMSRDILEKERGATGNESWGFVQECEKHARDRYRELQDKINSLEIDKNNLIKGSQDKVTEINLLKKKNKAITKEYNDQVILKRLAEEQLDNCRKDLAKCKKGIGVPIEQESCLKRFVMAIVSIFRHK